MMEFSPPFEGVTGWLIIYYCYNKLLLMSELKNQPPRPAATPPSKGGES